MHTASALGWRWPLASLGDRNPVIHAHRVNDRRAIELGYPPSNEDANLVVPVRAAQSGTVVAALAERDGYIVVVDHEPTYATRYSQLSHLRVRATDGMDGRVRERVRAGDVLGFITRSPLHMRFELWRWSGRDCVPDEPYTALRSWGAPALDVVPAVSPQGNGA